MEPVLDTTINLSEAHVVDAIERLASGRALGNNPLVHAHCVTLHILDAGIEPSPMARTWALSTVLAEIVQDRLGSLRDSGPRSRTEGATIPNGFAPAPTRNIAASPDLLGVERECLERDFLTDNHPREAWSCLYYRFIHVPRLHTQDIASVVRPGSPHGRKLISRRTRLGMHLLAVALLDRERAALHRIPMRGLLQPTASATLVPVTASTTNAAPDGAAPTPAESPVRWTDPHTVLDRIRADVLAGTVPLDLPRDQARLLAAHTPAGLAEYRLTRIAAWCRPRYALDKRFVALSMLVDAGEDAPGGRWSPRDRRYDDLTAILTAITDPVLVLLGPPGSGKSTLLGRLEFDLAVETTRAGIIGRDRLSAQAVAAPITFFVELGRFVDDPDGDMPEPLAWLTGAWGARYPGLPALDALLAGGGVILLLDALNEMPHADPADYRRHIHAWRAAMIRLTRTYPGNRVIFSCRSLDYSAPLSSPELRVPQVQVDPLDDARIRAFLETYCPDHAIRLWESLENTAQIEIFRAPYSLKLLVEEVGASGSVPQGRAALFTRMVRSALRREVERANPLFDPGPLIAERDYWRIIQAREWTKPHELPEGGALFGDLAGLAFGMQQAGLRGEGAQVRLPYGEACARLGQPHAADILRAGESLGVLDDDAAANEVRFTHQLAQEYFAARRLAATPDPSLVRAPWRAIDIQPGVRDLVESLPIGETLPPLPQTGWEETALLAAPMAVDPEAFVRGLMEESLVVAGRCANLPEVRERLSEGFVDELRWALAERSRDPEADLRARIAAGLALGELGDPRFERRLGPHGEYLMPPMVQIAGGVYPIGEDEPIAWANLGSGGLDFGHIPRHGVLVAPFRIAQLPVTNAEWRCFMEAGGYEDARWWDTDDAQALRQGELAIKGAKVGNQVWRRWFQDDPALFDQMVDEGRFMNEETVERWRGWMVLDDAGFEAALDARLQAKPTTAPEFWQDERFNAASQPVVGVSWYEARAYCAWLSAQTGLAFRLPTEVEWEAAARGTGGRLYAYGDAFDGIKGNTVETHARRPTPVGIFVEGDTPEGVSDLAGNIAQWTSSVWGSEDEDGPRHGYPYDPGDGREDIHAGPDCQRVLRGGSWGSVRSAARAARRSCSLPYFRTQGAGFRCIVEAPGSA